MIKIKTEKTISIAHLVQTADKDSPCRRLHGHNVKIIVEINGHVKNDGMVVDFRYVKNIINKMDHMTLIPQRIVSGVDDDYINMEANGYTYTFPVKDCYVINYTAITAENLALHVKEKISEILAMDDTVKITVYESEKSCAILE